MAPRPRHACLALLVGCLLLLAVPAATPRARQLDAAPFDLGGGDRRVDPAAFAVTRFAAGLPYPLGMAELADGSLLVATSEPSGRSFYDSTGQLRRLVDGDGDGRADDAGVVVADHLPGALTALRRVGRLVYALSAAPAGSRLIVLRLGADHTAPMVELGSIAFDQSVPMQHATYALAVAPIAGAAGRHHLYFNVGAAGNEAGGAQVTLGGLAAGTLVDASIYRLTVDDDGVLPIFSDLTLIATGLRNAAGIALDPATGDLWFEDNGIDSPDNVIVSLSADELNVIRAAEIGGDPEDFGFPSSYVEYASGETVGDGGRAPIVAFVPRAGDESEGASQIAIISPDLPAPLGGTIVVGFHGQWDEVGRDNEENPLLAVDPASGGVLTVVGNDEPAIGHLDGVLATADALYIADLTGEGSLVGTAASGVIYRVAASSA